MTHFRATRSIDEPVGPLVEGKGLDEPAGPLVEGEAATEADRDARNDGHWRAVRRALRGRGGDETTGKLSSESSQVERCFRDTL